MIKIVKKNDIMRVFGEQAQKQFNETEIMKRISRKDGAKPTATNLLRLVESFEDVEHLYLVTNLMPGGDLISYLLK